MVVLAALAGLAIFRSYQDQLRELLRWAPYIVRGFLLNVGISAASMLLATVLGGILASMRLARTQAMRLPASLLIAVSRNTPWLVILYAAMLLIPFEVRLSGARIDVPGWSKAIVGFSLPVAANVADIVRGAMRAVPRGQREAAASLGLSRPQVTFLVVLPQCFKSMIPPWMNWYAILALSTPLAAILGVQEAIGSAQQAMASANSDPKLLVPFYSFVMLLFFAYIYPISLLTRRLEARVSRMDRP